MSQHRYRVDLAGRPIQVNMGWDRPLGHFFMVVEDVDADPDSEEVYLFSNMESLNPFGQSLDQYRAVLDKLGIVVPEQMFEQVAIDGENNVGNRIVVYAADGTFTG